MVYKRLGASLFRVLFTIHRQATQQRRCDKYFLYESNERARLGDDVPSLLNITLRKSFCKNCKQIPYKFYIMLFSNELLIMVLLRGVGHTLLH